MKFMGMRFYFQSISKQAHFFPLRYWRAMTANQ